MHACLGNLSLFENIHSSHHYYYQLVKKDADAFGSADVLRDPPSYWIKVYAEITKDTEDMLNYLISMTGVQKMQKIRIVRHLDNGTGKIILHE